MAAFLEKHGQEHLLEAAGILRLACPEPVYVGNADAGGYQADCRKLWLGYQPFAAQFEAALPLSPTFVMQYVTVAQVLWAHFRWESGFSPEAAGHFLSKAVALEPAVPVHYYKIFAELPLRDENGVMGKGKFQAFWSNIGVTCFYCAQYHQYHTPDWRQAVSLYERFVFLEPEFLPDPRVYLGLRFLAAATERWHPPSTQEAWTEMGRIYLQQEEWAEARRCLEKAVALRPDSSFAPYEYLAELHRQQNRLRESLELLARKNEVLLQARVVQGGYLNRRQPDYLRWYLRYNPSLPKPKTLRGSGVPDLPYYRLERVTTVADVYEHIADTYLYELTDYRQAGVFYKKFLEHAQDLEPHRKTAAVENQIRIAMDTGDYWQARALCEKLPQSETAKIYLARIKQRLGY